MKKQSALDRYVFRQKKAATVDKSKSFAVYHCGQPCFTNTSAAVCHSYIKKYALKGATVGYAR